ncbi:MAG: HlyD family type I secretion periplasmic adaptor subunit [Acidocella sp.]|uniref:HlyD family type I secretion periplasmic adaptor subunit n=1 Tax=Acidocella sp. TaxID=50710 RepID=UPI003FD6E51F
MLRLRQLLPKATSQALSAGDEEALPLPVLEFQSPTAAVIATPLPPIARSTTYILSALIAIMLIIAGTFKVDKLVVGTGTLNATTADSSIQVFNTSSIIREIKVHAGDFVAKGQVLATLDPTYATADLTGLTKQEQNYAAQVAQLQAQEDGTPYVPDPSNPYAALELQTYNQQMGQYNFTLQNYAEQINQLNTQIQGYQSQAVYYRQRLAIASNVEDMRKKLQQLQVGSQLDTLAATDDRVSMQTQLSQATSSAAADQRQLASVQAQRDSFDQQFKAQTSTQLATALNSLAQAQQDLAKAKLNNEMVELTAPQDSVVQSIAQISQGSVLQPGQQLMDLAPVDTPFTVEADIDATESGYVQQGDQVVIKFATLNPALYGTAKGTVTSVSAESFNPQDQQDSAVNGPPLPGAPQNLYYKAQVSLDVLNLHNVPNGFRLVPGMPVEADIVVGKRSILGYFLAKLAPVAYNSMHEP